MEYLFIGGPLDGERKDISRRVRVKWRATNKGRQNDDYEIYVPKRLVADSREFTVYRHQSLTMADVIAALLTIIHQSGSRPANGKMRRKCARRLKMKVRPRCVLPVTLSRHAQDLMAVATFFANFPILNAHRDQQVHSAPWSILNHRVGRRICTCRHVSNNTRPWRQLVLTQCRHSATGCRGH